MNGIYDIINGTCLPTKAPPYIYNSASYDAWAVDHAILLQAAKDLMPEETNYVIANNNASGVGGRQFEKWCNADFDKLSIADDITELQQAGAEGTVALVHGGEPCNSAALSLSLSAFLVGAGIISILHSFLSSVPC
jgi:hypothetical protein